MHGYVYIHTGTYRGQKGASDYLQLELQAEQHGCGHDLRASDGGACALNSWAASPAP